MPILEFVFDASVALVSAVELSPCEPWEGLPILGVVRMPQGIVRGIIQGQVMVAWAVAGRLVDEFCAITVETAPAYRGRGYGAVCVRAVALACPHPVLYRCDARNTASQRTAVKAGFVRRQEGDTLR